MKTSLKEEDWEEEEEEKRGEEEEEEKEREGVLLERTLSEGEVEGDGMIQE